MLSGLSFFIFDAMDPDSAPDSHSQQLKNIIMRHNGSVLPRYADLDKKVKEGEEDVIVIIK